MLSENIVYIIVIYVVITVDHCKCMLYSPLSSYLYVHWILLLLMVEGMSVVVNAM